MRILYFSNLLSTFDFFVNEISTKASIITDMRPAAHSNCAQLKVLKGKIVQNIDFKALINDYSAAVLNTAIRVLRDPQQAQDVHQEVFLEILRRWHKFNTQTNWRAYLYRVTVRKAIQCAKQSKMKRLVEQQEYPTTNERPDDQLQAIELQQKLVTCLTGLPKRQADVFVLSRIEGLRNEKIADLLGCSKETVRVHLHRAMKRLALELGDYLTE
jgi:RNA polymerase sigma-70 factor (ECF subfamily)